MASEAETAEDRDALSEELADLYLLAVRLRHRPETRTTDTLESLVVSIATIQSRLGFINWKPRCRNCGEVGGYGRRGLCSKCWHWERLNPRERAEGMKGGV